MKKYLLKNKIRNSFPVNIKSLRGPTTTVIIPAKGSITVMDYQLTGDVYIKQQNGILEMKVLEDYTDNIVEEVPVIKSTPLVVEPVPVLTIQQESEVVEENKKSKRGRKPTKVIDNT